MHPLDVFCSLKDFDPEVIKKWNYFMMKFCVIVIKIIDKLKLVLFSLLFEVSEEFVSTERVELDFLTVETAEETKDEEVMEDAAVSFLDSNEFFFAAESDFDLDVLFIEVTDSAVVSSVDSAETKVSCHIVDEDIDISYITTRSLSVMSEDC